MLKYWLIEKNNAITLITMSLREIKVYVSSEVPNPNGKHHITFPSPTPTT